MHGKASNDTIRVILLPISGGLRLFPRKLTTIAGLILSLIGKGEAMKRGALFRSFALALERLTIGSVFDNEGWKVATECRLDSRIRHRYSLE